MSGLLLGLRSLAGPRQPQVCHCAASMHSAAHAGVLQIFITPHACRASRKAASLEAALASAQAKAGALQRRATELQAENAALSASLSAARAERNALNAAVRQAASAPLSPRSLRLMAL